MIRTALTERLGIGIPVVQAPMGGGPTTPELVAAVSSAGGLGSVAGGYLSADQLRDEIRRVRSITDRPIAANVFAPQHVDVDPSEVERATEVIAAYRDELGLPPMTEIDLPSSSFDAQIDVLVEECPTAVSFTFGTLPPTAVDALHEVDVTLIGTATTVAEAVALVDAGTDVVCVQGSEAGAHRGTFLTSPASALVGTAALVPIVVDAVDVPVVAAGGIMDGRGIAAALTLGASAAQLGTAFLRCPEAGTSGTHRQALATADETSTTVTASLTGRAARAINNRLVHELAEIDVPAYPVMNALTSELRAAAARAGRSDLMSLWAGQGVRMSTELPAADLVRRLAEDTERRIERLGALLQPPPSPQ